MKQAGKIYVCENCESGALPHGKGYACPHCGRKSDKPSIKVRDYIKGGSWR